MADYDVGYGKPPKRSQFKPGITGNPKGRPKRKPGDMAGIVSRVRAEEYSVREQGRVRKATREELSIRRLGHAAVKGDVAAAKDLLDMLVRADRGRNANDLIVYVEDWIPDFPGQTAEQKTMDYARNAATAKAGR